MIKSYEKYKDSGIEWLGEIPENWKIASLKYQLEKIYGGGTPSTNVDSFWANDDCLVGFPWVAISDITKSNGVLVDTAKKITEAGKEDKRLEIVPKGTLLLSIFASLGKTVRLGIDATINQAILGLVPKNRLNLSFLEYLLIDAERYIDFFSSHNTQDNLNLTKIKNLKFPFPPLAEQTQIANYLDYQTNIIDKLIAKKERLIELLKEKRQSVINNAVTKGLDPNAKMKDSGIEWLGEVPEGWKIVKFKYIVTIKNGKDQKDVMIDEGGYPIFGTGGEFGRASECLYDKPSVLLGRKGTIDKPQFINEPFWTVDTVFYTEINEECDPLYVFYLSQLIPFNLLQESSAVPSMTQTKLNNVFLCKPTKSEQIEISTAIKSSTEKFDSVIDKNNKQIDNLKSYRQSIISEAVTGKIDLRDWKQPASN